MSDPNQNLKQHAVPNSSLCNLKIYSSKGCRKAGNWYVANTAILAKYLNFQLKISLQIMGFCFDW